MSTSPGSLEGKYEVLAKIREGGMGAIYKVRHRLLNELRVIKVMRPEVAQSSEQRKRFLREAQTATRLRHTNIVAFHDFFVDDEDTAYMVMEYIEGINLRDMVRDCGPFPVSLAVDLARQCLSAFDYLHRKGVVHRDVSPDNVMMTREEDGSVHAKLIDLGIAKIAQAKEELTGADEFIGKLRYSSPEQLTSAGQIDARSDLFSFGIVLYEILTGVRPYGGETIHEIVANRLNQPPLPFRKTDPKDRLSPAVRNIVLKALRAKPGDRYQTASEFGKSLEALAAADVRGESAEAVLEYVDKAMMLALSRAAASEGSGADLQPTVKALFEARDSLGQSGSSDRKVRSTIARWAETTPPRPDAEGETHRLPGADEMAAPRRPVETASTRPVAGAPEPEGKRPHFAGYLVAAALAALLVGFGVWIAGRDRRVAAGNPDAAGSVSTTLPAERGGPAAEPRASDAKDAGPAVEKPAAIPAPEPTVAVAVAPTIVEAKPTAAGVSKSKPTPAPRVALLRPTKAAPVQEPRPPAGRGCVDVARRRRCRAAQRSEHAVLPPVRRHGLQAGNRSGRPGGIFGRGHQGAPTRLRTHADQRGSLDGTSDGRPAVHGHGAVRERRRLARGGATVGGVVQPRRAPAGRRRGRSGLREPRRREGALPLSPVALGRRTLREAVRGGRLEGGFLEVGSPDRSLRRLTRYCPEPA